MGTKNSMIFGIIIPSTYELLAHENYPMNVGKTLIKHHPVITIFVGGMPTIPQVWVVTIVLPT